MQLASRANNYIGPFRRYVDLVSITAVASRVDIVGRNNAGKSTLIRSMTNAKGLVKTSQKPVRSSRYASCSFTDSGCMIGFHTISEFLPGRPYEDGQQQHPMSRGWRWIRGSRHRGKWQAV